MSFSSYPHQITVEGIYVLQSAPQYQKAASSLLCEQLDWWHNAVHVFSLHAFTHHFKKSNRQKTTSSAGKSLQLLNKPFSRLKSRLIIGCCWTSTATNPRNKATAAAAPSLCPGTDRSPVSRGKVRVSFESQSKQREGVFISLWVFVFQHQRKTNRISKICWQIFRTSVTLKGKPAQQSLQWVKDDVLFSFYVSDCNKEKNKSSCGASSKSVFSLPPSILKIVFFNVDNTAFYCSEKLFPCFTFGTVCSCFVASGSGSEVEEDEGEEEEGASSSQSGGEVEPEEEESVSGSGRSEQSPGKISFFYEERTSLGRAGCLWGLFVLQISVRKSSQWKTMMKRRGKMETIFLQVSAALHTGGSY